MVEALRSLPTRYTPLTYFTSAALLHAGFGDRSLALTIHLFWLVTAMGLLYAGHRAFPENALSLDCRVPGRSRYCRCR